MLHLGPLCWLVKGGMLPSEELATASHVTDLEVVPIAEASTGPVPVLRPSSPGPSDSSVMAPRRTGRVGAGQHSNVHHLPRTVGPGVVGTLDPSVCGVNTVTVLFRPWD